MIAVGGGSTSKAFFGSYASVTAFKSAVTALTATSAATVFIWGVNTAGSSLWVASAAVGTLGAVVGASFNTITGSNLDSATDLVLF